MQLRNAQPYYYNIKRTAYDLYEQKVFVKYANNTTNRYAYEPKLRRLSNLTSKTSGGQDLFNNTYGFDFVGNITSIQNTATFTSNGLGGTYLNNYLYDNLNRLTAADGEWTGSLGQAALGNNTDAFWDIAMVYDNMHRIVRKSQTHFTDQFANINNDVTTYSRDYEYLNTTHPNAVSRVKSASTPITYNTPFTYDANGNTTTQNDIPSGNTKSMYWDEDNMMRGIVVNDNKIQHYLYDAAGERTLKASGNVTVISNNGGIITEEVSMGNYTLYPSGYLVVSPSGLYTKHYYIGTERIASKIAGAATVFQTAGHLSGSDTPTLPARQLADLQGMLTAEGFENLVWNNTPPTVAPCTGLTGEALKQCLCQTGNCADVLYFFHPDHLGSSTFLTDVNGQAYEFVLYLPFGEQLGQQKVAGFSTPYRFTGKELDAETGLYYFGARYYDPSLGIFHGVDALAEKYPSWSPFVYTMNNPIRFTDPTGYEPEDWIAGPDGIPFYSPEVTNAESAKRIFGENTQYIGKSAIMMNGNGEQISLNANGTSTNSVLLNGVSVTSPRSESFVSTTDAGSTTVGAAIDGQTALTVGAGKISGLTQDVAPIIKGLGQVAQGMGIMGALISSKQAYDNPTLGNILKASFDTSLALAKFTPGVGALIGLADAAMSMSGIKDAAFNAISSGVDTIQTNNVLSKDEVRLSNYKFK